MAYYLAYIPLYLFSLLPFWFLYRLSDIVHLILYYIIPYRKKVVLQNLIDSFPDKSEKEIRTLCRKFYRSFTDQFIEMLKFISVRPGTITKRIKYHNIELFDKYYAKNQSVLASAGHIGNWEMAILLPLFIPQHCNAAYKELKGKVSNRLMIHIRSRFGLIPVPSQHIARHIMAHKDSSQYYLMVADQRPAKVNEKYIFEFMNQPTAMFNGVEKLAQSTGAAVVYTHMVRTSRGRYDVKFIEITETPKETAETEITRIFTRLLEENIKEQPESWLWTHKRWKRKIPSVPLQS